MLAILGEGLKIFSRNIRVKIFGFKKYSGNDEKICRQIIKECYDNKNKHFNTSNGNYKLFYSRDFGWCIESLLNLGYTKEVNNTLDYALDKYSANGKITVAINNSGKAFNFPDIYSPDSTAYFFRSLHIAKAKHGIIKYRKFLNDEISKFEKIVMDENGLLKDKNFSGMRDHTNNTKMCYDMIMACMLSQKIDNINNMIGKKILDNPLQKYNLKAKLIKHYWNGNYFNDSITDKYCSGHANVYPYYLDVITNTKMLKSSLKFIISSKLDRPIPLKYGYSKNTKFLWYDVFAHDWEKNTSWAMLGLAYIDVVSKIDKNLARKYVNEYKDSIIKNKCFIELYDGNKPYSSFFFSSDDSMLWASMYLSMKKKLK